MKAPEYEYWQAMHIDCPFEGCGECAETIAVDTHPLITRAAALDGMNVDAWLHMVMAEKVKELLP